MALERSLTGLTGRSLFYRVKSSRLLESLQAADDLIPLLFTCWAAAQLSLKMRLQICWRVDDRPRIQAQKASGLATKSACPWGCGVVEAWGRGPHQERIVLLAVVVCFIRGEQHMKMKFRLHIWGGGEQLLEERQGNAPSPFLCYSSSSSSSSSSSLLN